MPSSPTQTKGGAAHEGALSADIVGPGPGAVEYCPEEAQGIMEQKMETIGII